MTKKRTRKPMTDEEKQAASERMKKMWEEKRLKAAQEGAESQAVPVVADVTPTDEEISVPDEPNVIADAPKAVNQLEPWTIDVRDYEENLTKEDVDKLLKYHLIGGKRVNIIYCRDFQVETVRATGYDGILDVE